MKNLPWVRGNVMIALCAAFIMTGSSASGQSVQMSLNFQSYDVIFLSDFIDVASQKLAPNIPNISLELTSGFGQLSSVYIKVRAFIQLKGKSSFEKLIEAETKPFRLSGRKILSSRDFAAGTSSEIEIKSGYYENTRLRDELEDYAQRFPTAPVGSYRVEMETYDAVTNEELGRVSRTINIRNASASEVVINLIDPQEGAVLANTLPTFSWSSDKPQVTLYVYEKLPIHRSPEEAIQGIPHLKIDLAGASTFTYPPTASRRIESNKGYYWYVESVVTTNRGSERRQSEIRFFRVQLDNPWVRVVEQFLMSAGGNAAGTYATLQSLGWLPSTGVTLDGRSLSREEFAALVTRLVQSGAKVSVRVESQ